MAVVVDTSVVIGFLRGAEPDRSCLASILRSGEGLLTVVGVFELCVGLKPGGRQENAYRRLFDYLGVLPFDREAAEKAADLERNLRASGQTIGTRDVFIAGICLVRNLPLVTGNVEHFRRIPDLQVIPLGHWQEDVP